MRQILIAVVASTSVLLMYWVGQPAKAVSPLAVAHQSTLETPSVTPSTQLETPTAEPAVIAQPAGTMTESPELIESPAATLTPAAQQNGKLDWNQYLPAGDGRDLLLNNCDACHPFLCAVIGQRPVDRWEKLKIVHRRRVAALSDDGFIALFAYLEASFNDTKPQPDLPPELAGLGCTSGIR